MSWLSAAPAVALAAFWSVAPGLLAAYAWGLRGLVAWGSAPLLSVGVVSITGVVAAALGVGWAWWVPVAAAVLVAVVGIGVRVGSDMLLPKYRTRPERPLAAGRRLLRTTWSRLRTPKGRFARLPEVVDAAPTEAVPVTPWKNAAGREGPDGRWAGIAALAGIAIAVALGWLTAVNGMGPADALSQTYDAVFHYSAVAHIVGSGDASSLTLGTLTNPSTPTAFYPGAWHDMVSLAVLSTGTPVIPATNATALAVAVVTWPLGCLLLARQVLGRSAAVAFVTPVLAVGFTAFPWNLMTFGVLWPNLLGVALLPGALAAAVTLMGLARNSTLTRPGAAGLLVVALPTLTLAHPNSVFSLAVLALFPVLWGLAALFRERLMTARFWQPLAGLVVVAGLVWFVYWLMTASSLTDGVRTFDWPAFQTAGQSIWGVLTNSTNDRPEIWTVSVLVVVGIVVALRRASTSWMAPAHLASGFLYLQAASQEGAFTEAVTGAWYNDSHRLAAMVPVTGVPLAVIGLLGIAGLVRRALLAAGTSGVRFRRGLPAATVGVAVLLVVAISGGMSGQVHAVLLASPYRLATDVLLEPGQREFLERVGQEIPPDAVVADNPYAGNALLYPLTGREVLFPHLSGNWTPDMVTIAARLRYAATDPEVCDAVAATRVDYAISGPVSFWAWDGRSTHYPGLDGLDGFPGFEPVDTDGRNTLYRVTACDTIPITTNP
ncbi:DUF6541 family protein [Pseudonocardia endophytica]|nr:DUF6541 family protein [Pseudonocardia endophytica]